MPQPYTRSGAAGLAKRSRHLQLSDASSQSLHRMLVRNALEAKLYGVQRKFLEHATALCSFRMQQARRSILEQQKRLVAYKMVLQNHPIGGRLDHQAALNDDYSLHGLRHELRRMLHDLDPDTIRKRRINEMVTASYKRYRETVLHNKEMIRGMFPEAEQSALSGKPLPVSNKKPVSPSAAESLGPSVEAGLPRRARGLARGAQVVSQGMIKENAWLKRAVGLPDVRLIPSKEMNPRTVLPPIRAVPHDSKAPSVA